MGRIERFFNQILCFTVMSLTAGVVRAAEITAVDFNGNPLGQVISTGMVINPDGESIGYITADSLILDDEEKIVGGVVPQGVAIGTDNRLLGKIHTDGVVRSLSGSTIGRALPNGLVINQNDEVIGAVLYPGLVYSADGATIGRVTGAGTYTNLEGQEIGYVSANGYAYKKTGDNYVLDGRLISSKMIVSLEGRFIGSIAPSGKVVNFEGKEIGNIHANGYVYDAGGNIIGGMVHTSYAFDMAGNYLGIISYNGVISKGERAVGYYRPDGNVVNDKDEVIGFAVPMTSTANDKAGHYLGRLTLGGNIVRGEKVVGRLGAKGYVYDKDNNQIGELVATGPIFDILANLRGQAMAGGTVISTGGSIIGQMRGKFAYDANGTMIGSVLKPMVAVNNNNKSLGSANFNATIKSGSELQKVSPFGYLLNAENKVIGRSFDLSGIYGSNGLLYSYMTPNGGLYRSAGDVTLTQSGVAIGRDGYVGEIVAPLYALGWRGQKLGLPRQDNLIANNNGSPVYKVVPGRYVVGRKDDKLADNITPVVGFASQRRIALSTSGDLLGYAAADGEVLDLNGNTLGRVKYRDYVEDNNRNVIGKMIGFTPVVNEKCAIIGAVNGRGDIINNRDVIVGRLLPNGQAISDVGSYIGYAHPDSGLVDFDGRFSGTVNAGQGFDIKAKTLGCTNKKGQIVSETGEVLYGLIEPNPVIDFKSEIIGHVTVNGQVVDSKGESIGYVQPNGNVVAASKRVLGNAMKYAVAFDQTNNFLGMVQQSGEVHNSEGVVVGKVAFDGSVQKDDETIGYALYDFYVYDENFVTYGYLTKDGTVLSPVGSKLGKIDKGFVLNRSGDVVARGNRDYIVRDVNNTAIGDLHLDGNVTDFNGKNIGYLNENGVVVNDEGTEIARATSLQYYVPMAQEPVEQTTKSSDWADKSRPTKTQPKEKVTPQVVDEGNVREQGLNRRIVGIAVTPDNDIIGNIYSDGSVEDERGVQVGYRTEDGTIVDMQLNPIGIEQIKRSSFEEMFFPINVGNVDQYRNGSEPINRDLTGGEGINERYDPVKQQALAVAQQQHRGSFPAGIYSLTNSYNHQNISNFTGYEEDGWPGAPKQISTWRVDMSQMILEDKPIPAVLSRSVYASEGFNNGIPVTAIVERNVYSEEGRNIIIPAGSRVIGSMGGSGGGDGGAFSDGNSGGAVKIGITWRRLIRPDGSQFNLGSAQTADPQGRAGAIGYLDQQLLKRYSLPLLTTALQTSLAYVMARGDGETTSENGSSTTSARTEAANDARDQFQNQMERIFSEIMDMKANIRSVTYIPAGTRIIIFPNEDLWLNSPERNEERVNSGGGSSYQGRDVLLDDTNSGGGDGGSQVTYSSPQENVRPVGGGRPSSSPLVDSGGGNTVYRPTPQVPPSTTSQKNTTSGSSSDDVPDLL